MKKKEKPCEVKPAFCAINLVHGKMCLNLLTFMKKEKKSYLNITSALDFKRTNCNTYLNILYWTVDDGNEIYLNTMWSS